MPFTKDDGSTADVLRLKQGEEHVQAVERLRKEGWDVPPPSQLKLGRDKDGRYFYQGTDPMKSKGDGE